ncbi:MAG: penicillin-binding protein activator LpoB [Moraxellaceae bacterium]|nr:penicillin-binding protein activator LpoB [Moraxellaceae bacterium]
MKTTSVLLAALALGLSGCASVKYGDATATETVNERFGSTDLQITAKTMTESLLSSPVIGEANAGNKRPVMFVERIANKTDEHIDTESVLDSMTTKLLQSGKVRLVDMSRVESARTQLKFQNSDELSNPKTAIAFGQMVGAEFMFYGNLSSIYKEAGSTANPVDKFTKTRDVYYKFTLKLMNLKTGLVEWQDEQEIRKTAKRGLLGM